MTAPSCAELPYHGSVVTLRKDTTLGQSFVSWTTSGCFDTCCAAMCPGQCEGPCQPRFGFCVFPIPPFPLTLACAHDGSAHQVHICVWRGSKVDEPWRLRRTAHPRTLFCSSVV